MPDTGVMSDSDNESGVNVLFGMLPGGLIAGIILGGYLYSVKKSHRRF